MREEPGSRHDDRLDEALELLHRDRRSEHAELADVRERVLAAARAEADGEVVRLPRRVPASRRWLPAVAAAAAVLVLAVLVPGAGSWWSPPDSAPEQAAVQPAPSARDVLERAAGAALHSGDPVVPEGAYRRVTEHAAAAVHIRFEDGGGYSYLRESRQETRVPANTGDVWRVRTVPLGTPRWLGGTVPEFPLAEQEKARSRDERWHLCDRGLLAVSCDGVKGAGEPVRDPGPLYDAVPREPGELRTYLAEAAARELFVPSPERVEPAGDVWDAAVLLLADGLVPADLRAALFRVLAELPGVHVTERAAHAGERTGVAVGTEGDRRVREVIVDPGTGEFLASRVTAGPRPEQPWLSPGTLLELRVVSTTVVTGAGEVTGTASAPPRSVTETTRSGPTEAAPSVTVSVERPSG
ncbi:hypothetical protein B0I33_111215 [Prauserella shujinwangii]|uniref:CU044_5270 family protein n=1 Tax=Prauserella shujinwangii TaxID=1453103 RepID=A0A2T0LNL8_9PSEU|nr:CU044_5270 family protein [Prauserella shujinwangii]PRX44701.1 hypothetical protein B0I33_111215 [Prauserella shujinwangii]